MFNITLSTNKFINQFVDVIHYNIVFDTIHTY